MHFKHLLTYRSWYSKDGLRCTNCNNRIRTSTLTVLQRKSGLQKVKEQAQKGKKEHGRERERRKRNTKRSHIAEIPVIPDRSLSSDHEKHSGESGTRHSSLASHEIQNAMKRPFHVEKGLHLEIGLVL